MNTKKSTPSDRRSRGHAGIFFIVGMSAALGAGDLSLVSAALVSIGHHFGLSTGFLPWIVTSTSLAMGATLIAAGRACDRFGSRRIFLIGIVLFSAASLLAFGAANAWILVIARMLQGLGVAMIGPSAFKLIRTSLPEGAARHKAMAALGIAQGAVVVLGPLAGGVATRYSDGRGVFLIDALLSLPVAAVAFRAIPRGLSAPVVRASIDVAGTVLVVVTPVILMLSLYLLERFGLTSAQGLGTLGIGVLGGVILLATERRVATPLIPPALLNSPAVLGANIAAFAIFAAAGCLYVMTNMLTQNVLGLTPQVAGTAMMAYGVAFIVGSQVYRRLSLVLQPSTLILIGAALTGTGLLLLARLPDNAATLWIVAPELALGGLGAAIGILSSLAAGTASAADADQGVAASLVMTLGQIGLPIGVAVATSCMHMSGTAASSPEAPFRAAYGAGTVFALLAFVVGVALSRIRPDDEHPIRASSQRR